MSEVMDLKLLAAKAKTAARTLAVAETKRKNAVLESLAELLTQQTDPIMAANRKDLEAARERGLSEAMVDRLVLDEVRIKGIAEAVLQVAALPDPVGQITKNWRRPNGIEISKQRIPLGLILMIYESRPNVTIDAAALCLKAGNGIILRGGSEAFHSNQILAKLLGQALQTRGFSPEAACLVPTTDRQAVTELLQLDEYIDLVIPRGGEGLIRSVVANSRIPVIKHYKGVCHLYVDAAAENTLALDLLLNGKTSRPGVCNALETMLVHRDKAAEFLPLAAQALAEHGVSVRACPRALPYFQNAEPAQEADWQAEYLDLILAVRIVEDMDAAISHINQYGSDHTEVIATESYTQARLFVNAVQSSVVMVNASSRFSDGGQLGLGAEIGISTTKLHAYGPMGLESLTTEKFVVLGNGQVRV